MNSPGFEKLEPDIIFQAIEKLNLGINSTSTETTTYPLLCTGELIQLNSYENRVFEIGLESGQKVIAKFYRPNRWSIEQIQEEHDFLLELAGESLDVGAPLVCGVNSKTCHVLNLSANNPQPGRDQPELLCYALFPKIRARMPDELLPQDLSKVGRLLAQVHLIGSRKRFEHRWSLSVDHQGYDFLQKSLDFCRPEVAARYEDAAYAILEWLEPRLSNLSSQRIHGDAHRGNLLWNGTHFSWVDFDDCMNGPVIQDVWMLLNSVTEDSDKDHFFKGYEELLSFDHSQLEIIPALQGLRIIYYSGWIAQRYLADPSFSRLFPQFEDYTYWAQETESLERIAWHSLG